MESRILNLVLKDLKIVNASWQLNNSKIELIKVYRPEKTIMASREDSIYFARLAEQAERYEDMIKYMKTVAHVSVITSPSSLTLTLRFYTFIIIRHFRNRNSVNPWKKLWIFLSNYSYNEIIKLSTIFIIFQHLRKRSRLQNVV